MFWSTVALILQISFLQFVAIKEARSIACVEDLIVNAPENLTITYLNPKSVRISWSVTLRDIKKYEIMYKPQDASYRVVAVIAANFNSVTLHNLLPNTTYRMSVTAFHANRKYHSKPITFKTLDSGAVVTEAITNNDDERIVGNEITLGTPEIFPGNEDNITPNSVPSSPFGPSSPPQTYIQGCGRRRRTWDSEPLDMLENVRGIEVTIVIIVLLVWVGAIILFFNRWGKIRMLIPYQPDYKETQLKVPGTGACSSANAYQNQSGSALCCSQRTPYQWKLARHHDCLYAGSLENATAKRARFQSVSCQFMKLEGQSVPVRKSKSADYIPFSYGRYDHYRYRMYKKIPTVSISIASDSDGGGGLNEDSS